MLFAFCKFLLPALFQLPTLIHYAYFKYPTFLEITFVQAYMQIKIKLGIFEYEFEVNINYSCLKYNFNAFSLFPFEGLGNF